MIDTDYLVVGAGAAGMAFADSLMAESDCDVVIVDRRFVPGGHWNDAYPFVRLHQPSATYGVNSRPLGNDAIDQTGPNAGFYERATGAEICDYFRRVLEGHLLPSGRVRFYGGHNYAGDWSSRHVLASRLTGRTTVVRVRKKLVDATYLETSVPATHRPTFSVDPGTALIPVGRLVDVSEPPAGFTVLGAGKTAMDACCWLLDSGVDPDKVRWVRPRDTWLMDRARMQPLDLVIPGLEAMASATESLATATSAPEVFEHDEAEGMLTRLDRTVEATMFRGAILSEGERQALRQIERVVRAGHVRHVGARRIVLERDEIAASPGEVVIDCTAYGFRSAPPRPIFEPGRITLQSLQGGYTTYNSALLGFVESTERTDAEKNRICLPTPQPSQAIDWITAVVGVLQTFALHAAEPDLMAWSTASRLSMVRGMDAHTDDPRMLAAMARWMDNIEAAVDNGRRLLAAAPAFVRA